MTADSHPLPDPHPFADPHPPLDSHPLPDLARTLLDEILRHDEPGAEQLRAQLPTACARPGCTCGCGTLELVVTDPNPPRARCDGTFPVEGEVIDAGGRPVGGLVLFIEGGLLSSLEVFSYADDASALPAPGQVEWSRVQR